MDAEEQATEVDSELHALFEDVASLIRDTPVTSGLEVSNDEKLRMYGLFKHITVGPCDGNDPPSLINVVARAKYQAWAGCRDQTPADARLCYVQLAASHDHWLGQKCREMLNQYNERRVDLCPTASPTVQQGTQCTTDSSLEASASGSEPPSTKNGQTETAFERGASNASSDKDSSASNMESARSDIEKILPPRRPSFFEKHLGIQPLLPRGQLDISYADLLFAARRCLRPGGSSMRQYCKQEEEIAQCWLARSGQSTNTSDRKENSIVVGLSVRSLLDVYLTSRSYPPQSQVIVVPPVNIPGMMDVLLFHDLHVVPVDMAESPEGSTVVGVDVQAVKEAISEKTVAIMVVHPFGMICTTEDDMRSIRELSTKHKLDVVEDCAECFAGLGQDAYLGSPFADVSLFSFGIIKTATALGGGIAVLGNSAASAGGQMKRIQHTLYQQQTTMEYLWKVLKCGVFLFVAGKPILYGAIFVVCRFLGLDFDSIVSSTTRGFMVRDRKAGVKKKKLDQTKIEHLEGLRRRNLMVQLRKRPSLPLLSLLNRRLHQSQQTSQIVRARIQRCQTMARILRKVTSSVNVPRLVGDSQHLFWLFPIQVAAPVAVSQILREHGFDVPRGTSQLGCISPFSRSDQVDLSRTRKLIGGVLYLPVASRNMSAADMHRLAYALNFATLAISSREDSDKDAFCDDCNSRRSDVKQSRTFDVKLVVAVAGVVLIETFVFKGSFICLMLVIFVAAHTLRFCIADFYIDSSRSFAKYSSMLNANISSSDPRNKNPSFCSSERNLARDEKESTSACDHSQSRSVLNIDKLRLPVRPSNHGDEVVLHDEPPLKREQGAVFLTGATGFVGSLLLRDLLRHRESLSMMGGVVVLCRAKRNKSAATRISELLDDPMFSFLSAKEKSNLVVVVEGDVTQPNVGMTTDDINLVCTEMDISHIFHCAAAVNFTQTLEEAAVSNISSSLNLQSLTKRLKNKNAKYVHISTAFVHGSDTGTASSPLPEQLHSLHPFDPAEVYRSMLETRSYASAAMNELGFPNTYTFSKCICEHLLVRDQAVNTIIIRPSIVGPAVQEPYEGWAGEKPSTIVAAACLYMKYQWNLWCFGNQRVPFIPVDVVCRFVLAKAFRKDSLERDATSITDSSPSSSEEDDFERISRWSESSSFDSEMRNSAYTPRSGAVSEEYKSCQIFNAAWDTASSPRAMFCWVDYAVSVTQLGSVMGYFHRSVAYFGLLITVKVLPRKNLSFETYRRAHIALVQKPIKMVLALVESTGWSPHPIRQLSKLTTFLDLPLLFFPFMNNTFHFASELAAPEDMNGERYMFSCALAAERFLFELSSKTRRKTGARRLSISSPTRVVADGGSAIADCVLVVGGRRHQRPVSDLWWALTQPRGSYLVRIAGWVLIKILRVIATEVTFDAASFSPLVCSLKTAPTNMATAGGGPHVVLAPTHRSLFDFLILSYIFFAVPEVGVVLPHIAAADDFSRLRILGFFARMTGAFFLRRGRGHADPALSEKLQSLKRERGRNRTALIEVFIEGSRSRDRRFVNPKTGFLRCLANTGGDHVIVPITISYERMPDQTALANEAQRGSRRGLSSQGLFSWLKRAVTGKINIGRIHVAASPPIPMESVTQHDFSVLAKDIQIAQQANVCVSGYHIKAGAEVLGLGPESIRRALSVLGCGFWPQRTGCRFCENGPTPELPHSSSELWTIMLQYGHVLAPLVITSHSRWCQWLNPIDSKTACEKEDDPAVRSVKEALSVLFDQADDAVDTALRLLKSKGFDAPNSDHVVQCTEEANTGVPTLLLRAAASMRLESTDLSGESDLCLPIPEPATSTCVRQDFCPEWNPSDAAIRRSNDNDESLGSWGFSDSGFVLHISNDGSSYVVMKGNRYGISGKPLRKLVPFIEGETHVRIRPLNVALPLTISNLQDIPCDLTPGQMVALKAISSGRVSVDMVDRARHGTGHSQEDMYLLRSGSVSKMRIPDAVVWPSSEDEVAQLVLLACTEDLCIIPFGGGTNVTHATWCPTKETESRPIISLDTKLMNRILWVNEEDGLAHVEAGITGSSLVREMERRGYTIGHEPDSIEFSTLGGWIATKASGMKRSKYGNIEDIVKATRVAGSAGIMWQGNRQQDGAFGRESRGIDLCSVMIGSEGCFGVITSAIVRIWPLAQKRDFESVILPDFEHGLRFVRDIAKLGQNVPASVRLLDNAHFRLGQALQESSSSFDHFQSTAMKLVARVTRNFSSESIVCATITYEGSKDEVQQQQRAIKNLAAVHGGALAGSRTGRAGYELTFVIAYLRDFAMTYHFLGESFETFAPWSKLEDIVIATKQRIRAEHKERCLPGVPFVGCRVTQLYHEGACLYFYFCMNVENVKNPSAVFGEIERCARCEILEKGGSLSHHHGVGKLRAPFVSQMDAGSFRSFLSSLKTSIDPRNIFGGRNGAYANAT